jgi:hypothetical protein
MEIVRKSGETVHFSVHEPGLQADLENSSRISVQDYVKEFDSRLSETGSIGSEK